MLIYHKYYDMVFIFLFFCLFVLFFFFFSSFPPCCRRSVRLRYEARGAAALRSIVWEGFPQMKKSLSRVVNVHTFSRDSLKPRPFAQFER